MNLLTLIRYCLTPLRNLYWICRANYSFVMKNLTLTAKFFTTKLSCYAMICQYTWSTLVLHLCNMHKYCVCSVKLQIYSEKATIIYKSSTMSACALSGNVLKFALWELHELHFH